MKISRKHGTFSRLARFPSIQHCLTTEIEISKQMQCQATADEAKDMSKAQKRGNREAKKPKAIKKTEQPAASSSLIKTAMVSSDQPKKKR
jgi:hypothetical protein